MNNKEISLTKSGAKSGAKSGTGRLGTNPYFFFFGAVVFLCSISFFLIWGYSSLPASYCYLIAASLTAFMLCGFDKGIAGSKSMRVPEIVLFITALIGGSAGLLLGMKLFRHKTKKVRFHAGLAIILIIQVFAAEYIRNF